MQSIVDREQVSGRRFQFLREAIAGTHQDFTEGNLSRGIALLAIPTVLEMAMESAFGLVDALWVVGLGSDAMAAVGLTEALVILIFSVALGLRMATTATVARRIGEKDPEGAAVAAVQSVGAGVIIGILTGTLGAIFAPQLLGLMHAEPAVVRIGAGYTRLLLGGNMTIMLLFLINGVFRGSGDAVTSTRTLWIANLINMSLDPLFIYGWLGFPKLGVMGAAVATTIGRSIGVAYQIAVLVGGKGRVTVARRHLRIDWPVLGRLLRVGGTAMV